MVAILPRFEDLKFAMLFNINWKIPFKVSSQGTTESLSPLYNKISYRPFFEISLSNANSPAVGSYS